MAWDEWEQIKADVTGRQSVAMRLNQAPAEPGPSTTGAVRVAVTTPVSGPTSTDI
ncbi:hypothetical protein ACF1BP_06230 [Streptomyces sp. NPDC014735]|uniref:hypothetical protein n=1 Tax=unclassified Streptomyces TaxID=2593676 RepID=UPI0036F7FC2E